MKELVLIQTKLNAPKGQRNNFGKYNYRSAEDILEALKPLLEETNCYLNISDKIILVGDRYYVEATARITNSEGVSESASAYAREELTKKGMDASQITGSTSSYARKYALNGLFAIDDNKDADTDEFYKRTNQKETKKEDDTSRMKFVADKSDNDKLAKVKTREEFLEFAKGYKIWAKVQSYRDWVEPKWNEVKDK